jgi:hypothetical protein
MPFFVPEDLAHLAIGIGFMTRCCVCKCHSRGDLSPQRPGLCPRMVHLGFVMNSVITGTGFFPPRVPLCLPLQVIMPPSATYSFIRGRYSKQYQGIKSHPAPRIGLCKLEQVRCGGRGCNHCARKETFAVMELAESYINPESVAQSISLGSDIEVVIPV